MKVEVLLECNVDECPENIGCMCRTTGDVAINHHGVCVKAGVLPGFQKTSDTKEENPNSTQQLKSKIEQAVMESYIQRFGADGRQGEFAESVTAQLSDV